MFHELGDEKCYIVMIKNDTPFELFPEQPTKQIFISLKNVLWTDIYKIFTTLISLLSGNDK